MYGWHRSTFQNSILKATSAWKRNNLLLKTKWKMLPIDSIESISESNQKWRRKNTSLGFGALGLWWFDLENIISFTEQRIPRIWFFQTEATHLTTGEANRQTQPRNTTIKQFSSFVAHFEKKGVLRAGPSGFGAHAMACQSNFNKKFHFLSEFINHTCFVENEHFRITSLWS